MKKIGILSDTHGCWDRRYASHFEACDEIWHAGDIGSGNILDRLNAIAPTRAVAGNIDDWTVRHDLGLWLDWETDGVRVAMTHIGGYPGRYAPGVKARLEIKQPKIFIAGHSHILKVLYDRQLKLLHINPGAAGSYGWQSVRTLIRLCIDQGEAKDLEVIELAKSQ